MYWRMPIKPALLLGLLFAVPAAVGQTGAANILGEVYSSQPAGGGSLLLASKGMPVRSGAQVSAGDGTALVKLTRGGQLRVCPKTNVALSADAVGKSMVLGLNVGSMELQYSLTSGADLLITPDLQLQLISPGTFHLGISVGPTGDTCIRSLPGSSAAIFVSEMMGNGRYQIGAGKSVMFGRGKVSDATPAPSLCGCPAPPLQLASGQHGEAATYSKSRAATATQAPETTTAPSAAGSGAAPAVSAAEAKPAPAGAATQPSAVAHLESNSRFVFRGDDEGRDLYTSVSSLRLSTDNSELAMALLPKVSGPEEAGAAQPPAPAPAQATPAEKPPAKRKGTHRGLFHGIGHFFGRLFHL